MIFSRLAAELRSQKLCSLATIVRIWGSCPREVGARMLVTTDGQIVGTVGGGCGEAEIYERALELLEGGRAHCELVEVDLTEDADSDSGKVCGGRFEVLLEVLVEGPDWQARYLADQVGGCETRWVTALGADTTPSWKRRAEPTAVESRYSLGQRWPLTEAPEFLIPLVDLKQLRAQHLSAGGERFLLEPGNLEPELLIVGAGHIAQPLSALARVAGFEVTVYDDRPEYADSSRFAGGVRVECGPFEELLVGRAPGPHSHLVLVTRGHRHDQECLRRAVGLPFGYVGMIGSWRRTRAVLEELRSEGLDAAWLDRVFAPIGLDLGARNPEEIAVSIVAEMIAFRCQGRESPLSLRKVVAKRRSIHV